MTELIPRILLLDDSDQDALLVERELKRAARECVVLRASDCASFRAAIVEFKPDLVLADYALPDLDGLQALRILRELAPDTPCIIVSGSIGEERAVEVLQAGATDYVLKDRTARLGPAVDRALREVRLRAERRLLERQLLQAQKMEAMGRLAGGIAHDFNNLLTVICGYSELAMTRTPAASDLYGQLREIRGAGERAAVLTRQLLAFSRQQNVELRPLDINAVVANIDRLLRRIIGEDVDLVTVLAADLGTVRADPGQIEQVLMNLAVNARDAMPDGGKITVETANVMIDADATYSRLGLKAGPHVLLAMSDEGTGMDEETQARIFEPFFTTKPEGKGTGLGLATVYGIVRQSEGGIFVYSEPGRGTTFKVYLPRVDMAALALNTVAPVVAVAGGSERILVVEDSEAVRSLACDVLRSYGYHVLEASAPEEALALVTADGGDVALIVSDVVMPGMSGGDLVAGARAVRPGIAALFMSGYPDAAVVRHANVDAGEPFLQKPFLPMALARKVREVLDAAART
jgi:two-component system cell cycle sensor histidine kinase/response regulator CckA